MRVREPKLLVIAIAAICHEANRRLCLEHGDTSQPSWEDAPQWQKDSAVMGVEAILDGKVREPWDSHASWSEHKLAEGWKWGPVKDPEKKEHPCLVPFVELPEEQQAKDYLFLSIVEALSVGIPGEVGIGMVPECAHDFKNPVSDDPEGWLLVVNATETEKRRYRYCRKCLHTEEAPA